MKKSKIVLVSVGKVFFTLQPAQRLHPNFRGIVELTSFYKSAKMGLRIQ